MKIQQFYAKAIEEGMKADPRGLRRVKQILADKKKQYNELKEKDKTSFDEESLKNPYGDSRILNLIANSEIKRILVGIDLEAPEVLLAEMLANKGKKIDLLLAHHPEGHAVAKLFQVMDLQSDVLHKFGVPINVAEGVMRARIREVERLTLPLNHDRAVDCARLLNYSLMCLHTPADNCVNTYLQKLFDRKKPHTVGEVLETLKTVEEYKRVDKFGTGLKVFAGAKENRAGRVLVDMTGGTGGSKEMLEKLSATDVGTIVGMHISEDRRKEAEKHHINVVIAGHVSSDTLGMNLLLDRVLKKTKVDVIGCSGFFRVAGRG
jgi:putative NIF3 family GTP cyclohydrolase 1 type 2